MTQADHDGDLTPPELRALRRLLDEAEIRGVLTRLARGANRGDAAASSSAYHPDAVEHHGPFRGPAREFANRPRPPAPAGSFGHHVLAQSTIDLDADEAFVETYFLYSYQRPEGEVQRFGLTIGRYLDRMVRRDGEWRILVRRVLLDGGHHATASAPLPSAASFTPGRSWPDDDVYHPGRLDDELGPGPTLVGS